MEIKRTRGDTNPDVVTVKSAKTKQVVNLTGCQFKLTVSSESNPVDTVNQLYQLTGLVEDPTTGVVSFTPTPEQSDNIGMYFYDIQMVDSFNSVITLAKGPYLYTQDITK